MVFKKGHKPLGRALKGHIASKETKQKISNKYKERIAKGWISPLNGRFFSEETRQKMKDNHTNVSGENNPMFGKKPGRQNQWGRIIQIGKMV